MMKYNWGTTHHVGGQYPYHCGWCGNQTVSSIDWTSDIVKGDESFCHMAISICAHCTQPTIFTVTRQYGSEISQISTIPAPNMEKKIAGMPNEIKQAYAEACNCLSQNAPTAAVMMCRKLLVYVAVQEGAEKDWNGYEQYVDFLKSEGHVPPKSHKMADFVRKIGNSANHELKPIDTEEAETLLNFMGMLLTFIYAFHDQAEKLSDSKKKK